MKVFFERHHASLCAFLRSRGADEGELSDAVQDAMLDVWRKAGQFAGKSSPKTWLFAIARNKLTDLKRKSARLSFVEDVPESVDEAPDAEALLISAGDVERVRICISGLKPDHLSAIRLAFFDDMTYREISQIEQVPEGTIKTRIFHAKQQLMRCLAHR